MNYLIIAFISILAIGCGKDGQDGNNGSNGERGARGNSGHDGTDGSNGSDGADGRDGYNSLVSLVDLGSCVSILSGLDVNRNLSLEAEEVQHSADVCDGEIGEPAIVELIDPCGDAPGIYDEVLIRLSSGEILASFSENANGKNTRFAVLTPSNYITTDGSSCQFTVTGDGEVI